METGSVEKIKSEMRLVEKIGLVIPGYRGYRLREMRRDADKLVRNHLYQKLSLSRDDLKVSFQKIVEVRLIDVYAEMDRLVSRLDSVASQINYASYGYAGYFDPVKIQEDDLDRIIEYDSKLIDHVNVLDAKVKQFRGNVESGNFVDVRKRIQEMREVVDTIDRLMSERRRVMQGV
ncbi:MAG: hypothetical protein QXF26_07560 [Candidatus Bathyarchaeia archaeon]